MKLFYERLSYTFGNEDWRSDRKALQTSSEDRLLCVTASGDRPLHLLLAPCREVVAIDKNPYQTALLELKAQAISRLEYDEYAELIGLHRSKRRLELYWAIEEGLSCPSKSIWEREQAAIQGGLLYRGATERYIRMASRALRLLFGRKFSRLLSHTDLQEQRKFAEREWNTRAWRWSMQLLLHPRVIGPLLADPGHKGEGEKDFSMGPYVFDRLHKYISHHLARNSAFVNLLFRGEVPQAVLPPYLQPEGFYAIKPHVHKIRPITADLLDYLHRDSLDKFDGFTLSDVPSYLPQERFHRLLEGMLCAASPNARFCLRQFLTNHTIPNALSEYFCRDHRLESAVEEEDSCFLYRFFIGHLLQ